MSWINPLRRTLSEEKFATHLIDRLHEAGDRRTLRFDAATFRLCFPPSGEGSGYANLRNLYDEYLTCTTYDRDRFFQFATRSLLASHKQLPDEFSDARSDIFLSVRNRSYFSLLELDTWIDADPSFSWPYQPLAEHLGVGLAYDLPEAMIMLQASDLEDWGVTFYEVLECGMSNLTEIDATYTTIDDYSYVSATDDHYDASRMLLPELIRELDVKGDPVVLLPNRDRLLVTGSDDRHGLETIALLAQQLLMRPRPLTGLAFRLVDDQWTHWLPDRDHPAHALIKLLAMQSHQRDYRQQRSLLQRWLATTEPQLDVSEFRTHGAHVKQPPTSFCVWQEGQAVLLPQTDRVCFLRRNQPRDHPLVEGINVSWPRVETVLGDLLHEETSLYPFRYRADQFPTEAQLEGMGSRV